DLKQFFETGVAASAAASSVPTKTVIPKDFFEAVWAIVKECGEEERHFNQLQSVYRGLASTWILATFGAVGYLLFNKEIRRSDLQSDHYLIAGIICLLGGVGISLVWMLDLRVYHKLLIAVFEEGRALEDAFSW